jgi:hypothetical protein
MVPVGVRGAYRVVMSTPNLARTGGVGIHDAADHSNVRQPEQRLESGAPERILEGGFGDHRHALPDHQLDGLEEDSEGT